MEVDLGLEGGFNRLIDRRTSKSGRVACWAIRLQLWLGVPQNDRLCFIIKAIPNGFAGGIEAKPLFGGRPNLSSIRFRCVFGSKVGSVGLDGINWAVNVKGGVWINNNFIIMIIVVVLDVMEEYLALGSLRLKLIIVGRCGRK
jgi:hypothetical protein